METTCCYSTLTMWHYGEADVNHAEISVILEDCEVMIYNKE